MRESIEQFRQWLLNNGYILHVPEDTANSLDDEPWSYIVEDFMADMVDDYNGEDEDDV